ncbi:hypothetical protein AOX55_00001695 [Sinorhizobium fredii CCBAU 25509]|nr:hypothetical protein AOX55_00001695 [Sinorhizobium fredii CCBAU 25509]
MGGETVLIELNNLEAFNLSTGLALLAKHFSEHMGLLEREYEEGREVEEEYVVNEYGCEIPRRLAGDDFRPQPPKPAAPTIQQSGNVLDFSAALRARQNCGNPPSAA